MIDVFEEKMIPKERLAGFICAWAGCRNRCSQEICPRGLVVVVDVLVDAPKAAHSSNPPPRLLARRRLASRTYHPRSGPRLVPPSAVQAQM